MNKEIKKCYNQDHQNVEAVYYCLECKIYICNKCESFHSKLFNGHHIYTLDKNISEIFTGFCKEGNHYDKLEYFCKSHNQLCCSGCIAKIKRKDKGQHSDCEICLIEDIKESKKNILNENLLNLEKLSKNINKLIEELKSVFEKINQNKEELKLNIQKIFTKVRNAINDREDELLLNVDELFDNTYMKENEMNEIDKYPNKIKLLLIDGKNTIDQWTKETELNSLINNCIKIEKNLININNIENNLENCQNEMTSVIKFAPSDEVELNKFISILTNFGKIYKEKKDINDKINQKIEPKIPEQNICEIEIKPEKEISNNFSINIYNFGEDEYNIYYPNNINYGENEIVCTFHLDAQNDYIEIISAGREIYQSLLKNFMKFSIRKREKKLILDFLFDKESSTQPLLYLYEYIFKNNKISMKFKNDLTFEKFEEMTFEQFFLLFASLFFSLKFNFKNFENSIALFEKQKFNIKKNEKDLIYLMNFLNIFKNTKISLNFDINSFFKLLNTGKEKINDKKFSEMRNAFKSFLMFKWFGEIEEGVNFNKILITLLFAKFKSGFVLEVNTKGIKEFVTEIKNKNK